MWRALFLGIGIYLMIAGAECLAVERVVWRGGSEPAPTAMDFGTSAAKQGHRPGTLAALVPLVDRCGRLPLLVYDTQTDGQ